MANELPARFWSKVNKDGSTPEHMPQLGQCWEWTGCTQKNGYGRFKLEGRAHLTHRLSHQVHSGESADGLDVDHMCWNRICVRPDHLRAVTRACNMQNRSGLDSNNTSGYRNVCYVKSERTFKAFVKEDGKTKCLGSFSTAEQAHVVAQAWRREYMPYSLMDMAASSSTRPPVPLDQAQGKRALLP